MPKARNKELLLEVSHKVGYDLVALTDIYDQLFSTQTAPKLIAVSIYISRHITPQ